MSNDFAQKPSLRHCPFCQSIDVELEPSCFYVKCNDCEATGPMARIPSSQFTADMVEAVAAELWIYGIQREVFINCGVWSD